MGNETSSTKQQFLGQKYIVTDHALRVGFRNKPDLDAYYLSNKKDKNSKISIEQGELVTLKPGTKVMGQDGTEFIQILEPEWDWEGKTYKVKGKYLPLTNPKYGVCLEEYDGKPKLELFEDDAGFETVAKDDDFNDEAVKLQKAALVIAKDVEKMDMGDAKKEFKGEATSEIIKKQTAYVAHRNNEAKEVSKEFFGEPKMGEKILETIDNDIVENPEWKYARNLYTSDKWATLDYHQEDGQTYAFDETDVNASDHHVVALLKGRFISDTEIILHKNITGTNVELSDVDEEDDDDHFDDLKVGMYIKGKYIIDDCKIKEITHDIDNSDTLIIKLSMKADLSSIEHNIIKKKTKIMFAFEEIYNKNELWNKRPMGITTEESNLNQMKLDSDLEKRKNALTR